MKSLLIVASIIIGLGCAALPAHAVLLDGKTVSVEYLLPEIYTPWVNHGNVVVGSGVEFADLLGGVVSLDIAGTQLINNYNFTGTFNPANFHGYHIYDVNSGINDITSVTINYLTNMAGFDSSIITFDANNIWINWQSLLFNADSLVVLDVNNAAPVPEPSTFIIFGAGLAGLAVWKKKRKIPGTKCNFL